MSEGRETESDTERDRDRGREERLRPSGRKTERGKKKELGVEIGPLTSSLSQTITFPD